MEKVQLPPSITIPTNYNNKLACDWFIHIQVAPPYRIPESVADTSIIEFKTADGSHPPITVKIYDAARVPFRVLPASWVILSHGMSLDQFQDMVIQSVPHISPETEMAVFFYQKIVQE